MKRIGHKAEHSGTPLLTLIVLSKKKKEEKTKENKIRKKKEDRISKKKEEMEMNEVWRITNDHTTREREDN